MKKRNTLLGILIFWVIIFVVLLVFFFVLMFGGNRLWSGLDGITSRNTVLLQEESYSISNLDAFLATTGPENIVLTVGSGSQITVRQYGDPNTDPLFTSSSSNGRLSIRIPDANTFALLRFTIHYNPRLEIEIPAAYTGDLSLSASSGDIRISNDARWRDILLSTSSGEIIAPDSLEGLSCDISASSGNVSLDHLTAETIAVKTSSGEIRIRQTDCTGKISISASSGDIQLDSGTADLLNIGTTSGGIRLGDIQANAVKLEASSGDINTGALDIADRADFSVTSGRIRIDALRCETFDFNSNSGEIQVTALSGMGQAESTSGDITFKSVVLTGNSQIRTSSGSVRVDFAPAQNARVSVTTSSGSISSNYSLAFSDSRQHAGDCTVGNGTGASLVINTSSGSVWIG